MALAWAERGTCTANGRRFSSATRTNSKRIASETDKPHRLQCFRGARLGVAIDTGAYNTIGSHF